MPLLKADLRRTALARRRQLSEAAVAARSRQLSELLLAHFPVAAWHWLHLFLPLARHHEPDTWLLIRQLWAQPVAPRLAVPVVLPDGVALHHGELRPDTPLLLNRWGIPEPALTAPSLAPTLFDAVLVPLLAFDPAGQRVGYGGGFYDRFLAQCRPGTPRIGLTVLDEPPVAEIADVLPTDVPLTACITPSQVWRF